VHDLKLRGDILGVWRSVPCKSVDGSSGKKIRWKNLPVIIAGSSSNYQRSWMEFVHCVLKESKYRDNGIIIM